MSAVNLGKTLGLLVRVAREVKRHVTVLGLRHDQQDSGHQQDCTSSLGRQRVARVNEDIEMTVAQDVEGPLDSMLGEVLSIQNGSQDVVDRCLRVIIRQLYILDHLCKLKVRLVLGRLLVARPECLGQFVEGDAGAGLRLPGEEGRSTSPAGFQPDGGRPLCFGRSPF